MEKYTGTGASRGIAIGQAHFYDRKTWEIPFEKAKSSKVEWTRFLKAKHQAAEELEALYQRASDIVEPAEAILFQIHRMLLEDRQYTQAVEERIYNQGCTAEYAVQQAGKQLAGMFALMDSAYMRERSADMMDISDRVLGLLLREQQGMPDGAGSLIVIAKDLLPSEAIRINRLRVSAVIAREGSQHSHASILTRAMGIPSVVMLGEQIDRIQEGDVLIVDGFHGEVIANPDEATLQMYRQTRDVYQSYQERLAVYKEAPTRTKDGTNAQVCGNIGNVKEAQMVLDLGGEGIGLFRSEYLYMDGQDYPEEQVQFEAYRQVLEKMGSQPVTIRTMDLGSEKAAGYFKLLSEQNPMLGLRAVRLSLKRPDIFKVQLRALLRASVYGNLSILFPMVSNIWQLRQIKSLMEDCQEELDREHIAYNQQIKLGITIATPAAALLSDQLAKAVDFFLISSSRLASYTLAVDPKNSGVSDLFYMSDPAVLRLLQMTAANAKREGIPCGISGEMAYNRRLIRRLLEMGITRFVVPSANLLEVREWICSIDLKNEENEPISQER